MLHKISADVVTKSPEPIRSYLVLMRLDRPTGYVLYLLPGLWSVAFAFEGPSDLLAVLALIVAAVLIRGFACASNDVTDKEIDRRVARTVGRPIAAGTISVRNGILWAAAQALAALLVLAAVNVQTALVALATYPLIVAYPFMKRFFVWPSAFLGLVMSTYVFVGWTAATGDAGYPPQVYGLFVAGTFWTMIHDAIYSHQDKEYDRKIGVKSSALLFGNATKAWLSIFILLSVASLLWAGSLTPIGWAFYLIVLLAAIYLCYLVVRVDLDNPKTCWDTFVANTYYGWIVLAAVIAGRFT